MLVRAVFLFYALFLVVSYYRPSKFGIFLVGIFFIPIFNIFLVSGYIYGGFVKFTFETVSLYIKSISVFLFFLVFQAASQYDFKKIIKFSLFMALIYFISIILSFVFSIDSMKTYQTGRFGFKGIVSAANELASISISVTAIILLLKDSSLISPRKCYLYLFVIVLSSAIVGTKGAFVGVLLIYLLYSVFSLGFFRGTVISVLSLASFSLFIYSVYNNYEPLRIILNSSIDYFKWSLVNFANGSYITLLLSGRDILLAEAIHSMMSYGVLEYVLLFGGWLLPVSFIEMEFFEILFMMGMPICLVYLYCWFNLFYEKRFFGISIAFIIAWSAMAFLAGHLFTSAVAVPFLSFLAVFIKRLSTIK
ncbi:hypothetical protein [Shewanella algae]|uniref:hypothetical protein n=1 Tax=Shewanella algae TaxID=38313 RepID=UPI003AAFFECA